MKQYLKTAIAVILLAILLYVVLFVALFPEFNAVQHYDCSVVPFNGEDFMLYEYYCGGK